MEHFNDFPKGINKEFKEKDQPQGTYIEALNAIRRVNGTLFNESGTTGLSAIPTGYKIIGSFVLENDIVLFLTDNTSSEIGVIDKNNNYSTVVNNSALNFNTSSPIDCQSRSNFKSDRIIYWTDFGRNPPRILDLDNVNLNDLNLMLTYVTPDVSIVSVNEDGNLPTGMYFFAVRLLTSSTNPTAFGLVTNGVPITDKNKAIGRDSYDGALPQTPASKSITIEVNNIDDKFSYIEIAALTYVGLSNQFSGNIIARIPIQGRTSISFNYNSEIQHKNELTLSELVQEFPNYISAKCIEQKDGRLFLSNLKTSDIDLNFQKVANNIVLKYEIQEVEVPFEDIVLKVRQHGVSEGSDNGTDIGTSSLSMNDYKNEMLTYSQKSYRREEVYSFAIVPIIDGSIIGNAFHIPGNDRTTNTTTDADITTKILGTYVSNSEYPTGFNYPRTDNQEFPAVSNYVRHHKFPTTFQENTFRNDGTKYLVRTLGVKVTNLDFSILGDQASRITGYVLVRQPRQDQDKSIVSQGIAQVLGTADTSTPYTNFYLSPVTGKYPWFTDGVPTGTETQTIEQGAGYVGFLSPETTLLQKTIKATSIAPVMKVLGRHHGVAFRANAADRNDNYYHSLMNYHTVSGALSSGDKQLLDPSTIQYVPADTGSGDNSFYNPNNVPIKILTESNNGFLFFKLSTEALNYPNEKVSNTPEFLYRNDGDDNDLIVYLNEGMSAVLDHETDIVDEFLTGGTSRYIYNLYNSQPSQYGEVYDAKYMYCGHSFTNLEDDKIFFGGDTFIGKIALVSKTRKRVTDGVNVDYDVRFFTTSYLFLESEVNVNFRHYITPTGQNEIGTIPYYPKNKAFFKGDGTGIYEVPTTYGQSTGYNKQYSFENTLKYYFPKQLAQEDVTRFENRTIYSEQSIEGEQFDAYRLFLPNNYHDIPKNKGAIVDTFVYNGSFYIHTSQSLWKAAVNERTTQTTSSGEVALGNGGMFPRPSEEMFTVSGGYAGTQSQWAGCNTPYGRFFVDNIQGKVFLLNSEIQEISNPDLFNFFRKKLTPPLLDSPANNLGWISSYDYSNKRWLLTNTSISLKPEYISRFKGFWDPTNQEFMSSLVINESIVFKDGQFLIYKG